MKDSKTKTPKNYVSLTQFKADYSLVLQRNRLVLTINTLLK